MLRFAGLARKDAETRGNDPLRKMDHLSFEMTASIGLDLKQRLARLSERDRRACPLTYSDSNTSQKAVAKTSL